MQAHPEWHEKMVCKEGDHPELQDNEGMSIQMSKMWQQKLDLDLSSANGLVARVTPAMLKVMAAKNATLPTGGCLFTNPSKWVKIMPGTRSARWQILGGGDVRLKEIRQQSKQQAEETANATRDEEDKEATAKRLAELLKDGAYEVVPESVAEEEMARKQVRTGEWRKQLKVSRKSSHTWSEEMTTGGSGTNPAKRQKLTEAQAAAAVVLEKTKSKMESRKRKRDNQQEVEMAREVLQSDIAAQVVYSPCFTIEKPGKKKRRLLQNYKASGGNTAIRNNKHRQDGVPELKGQIRAGDRFLLWDLTDAFHQVLVQERYRRMMQMMV